MALQLTKTLNSGLVANYWNISTFIYDRNENRLTVNMLIYADLAARQAGKTQADQVSLPFTMSQPQLNQIVLNTNGNVVAGIYGFLKTQSDFLTALDI